MFIDETGLYLNMTRTHARSKRGERAYASVPSKKHKIANLIGAITLEGVIADFCVDGGTTGEVFTGSFPDLFAIALTPILSLLIT